MAEKVLTEQYAIYNADNMQVLREMPERSVHFSVYSPPFCGLYQYSSDPEDYSNSKDYAEFLEHYAFLVRELHRVTLPGRMTAVHCTDIINIKGASHTIDDFPGDIIRLHKQHGWSYVARIHIWKEPLKVRNRTMVSSLHHATLIEDSTLVSIANADYLLAFRRSGKNEIPVHHPRGLMDYAGAGKGEDANEPADGIPAEVAGKRGYIGNQIKNSYSQWIWRQYASSNWYDIRIDRTLGGGASLYSGNRAEKDEPDEKHMHPLQLDVIERAVILWSNPGETVLTPFMGIGSEVYGAVINGRRGVGIELKPAYFRQAVQNLESIGEVTAAINRKPAETRNMFDEQPEPEPVAEPEPACSNSAASPGEFNLDDI
jgi:DNA modification methylase